MPKTSIGTKPYWPKSIHRIYIIVNGLFWTRSVTRLNPARGINLWNRGSLRRESRAGVGLQEVDIGRPVIKGLVERFQSLVLVAYECRQCGDSIVLRRKCPFLLLRFQDRPLRLQNALPASVLVVRIKSVYQFTAGTGYLVFNSRRIIAHMGICTMGVTFAGPGGSKIRVKINCVVEELDRTFCAGLISFLDQIHPL